MSDLGTCRGERRPCSAPAVVVRQGRPLCAACDGRRRAGRRRRQEGRRDAQAERAHAAGERCAQGERVGCRTCAPTWWRVAYPPPDHAPRLLALPLRTQRDGRLVPGDGVGAARTAGELEAEGWRASPEEAVALAEAGTRADLARLETKLAQLRALLDAPVRRPRQGGAS